MSTNTAKPPTLKDVCAEIVDCEHKTAPTQSTGYPSIRTPNIGRGRLILEGVNRVAEETYKIWTRRTMPQPGDLILAREAPVGNVAIIPSGLRVCLGQRTVLIRPDKSKVDPHYLTYLLLGDEMQGRFSSLSNGATVGHLNVQDIRNLVLPPLHNLHTQRKVASIVSAYDDLIENNTRRIKILEEMAQMIYREWFVNFRFPGHEKVKMVESELGRIPEGWSASTLGCLAESARRSVNPTEVGPDTPYIGLEHIPRKSIALAEWGSTGQVQSTKLSFYRGEILFGKIRPYFHKVGVAPVDGVCSSDAIVIVPRQAQFFSLVLCCVSSDDFVNHATQTSQGTKMPRANWDVLIRYGVPVPETSVLSRFNESIVQMVNLIHNFIFKNLNLRQTLDHLLPKLISGKIAVPAAEEFERETATSSV